MTYAPLGVILAILVLGAAGTLTVLFYASQKGYFRNLKAEAYLIFDEDEPLGTPQDQLFRDADNRSLSETNDTPDSEP